MTGGICLPIDADPGTNLPVFPAADNRVADGAFLQGRTDRPLGAQSGVHPGSLPTVTVTGTTWTVTPLLAVVDPETALTVGAYRVAFKSNQTGSVDAADGAHARIDRLDIQVPDDPAGSDPLEPVIVYTAGVAEATPDPSAAPARSTPLGEIHVPQAGHGSPAFVPTWYKAVAAGGITPALDSDHYPPHPFVGQYLDDPTLGLLRWNGTGWEDVLRGAWTDYAPALTRADTGAAITQSAHAARYKVIGKTVFCKGSVTASGSSGGGGCAVALPFTARDRDGTSAFGGIFGSSPPSQSGTLSMTSDKARLVVVENTLGFADIASGQLIRWNCTYELP